MLDCPVLFAVTSLLVSSYERVSLVERAWNTTTEPTKAPLVQVDLFPTSFLAAGPRISLILASVDTSLGQPDSTVGLVVIRGDQRKKTRLDNSPG